MKLIRSIIITIALVFAIGGGLTALTANAASCASIYHPSERDTSAGCAGLTFGQKVQATQICRPALAWKPQYTMLGAAVGNGYTSTTFSCAGTVISYGYRLVNTSV